MSGPALTPAPVPQAGEALRSESEIVVGTTVSTVSTVNAVNVDDTVAAVGSVGAMASSPSPAPAGEGRGEGSNEAGAQIAPEAAQVLAKPAPTTHTATVGHPSKPQAFAKQTEGPGVGGAVFALILVVSLILALGWLAKRMPGFARATGGGNALRVVGSLTLGPRDRVVVVDVGGTQLLLGVGQNGMTTLHTLSEPLPVAQPSHANPGLQNLATPFAQLLQKHLGKKP